MSNQPTSSDEPVNQKTRKRPLVEIDKPTTVMCTVVAIDHTNLCYRVCSVCEKTLPENPEITCKYWAARVLFGCSADEFFDFAKTRPYAAMAAGEALEGEMLAVTLSKPKNGNAQHIRVVSVVPLRSNFQPAIVTLREVYRARGASSQSH